jgi:transcriptional regulator with XRE-family HTH domain
VTLESRIEALRLELKLTKTAFAKCAGVTRQALHKAFEREREEGAHNIDHETAQRIAKLGGRSLQWVLAGEETPPPTPQLPQVRSIRSTGSLRAVRAKLYKRYDKRTVDAVIGASDYIDAAELNELDAFDHFDTLLAADRLAKEHEATGAVTMDTEAGVSADDEQRSRDLWPQRAGKKAPGKGGSEPGNPSDVPPRPRRNVR